MRARTPCADLRWLEALLSAGKFDLANEKATQAEMEETLVGRYGAERVSREHRLGPGDIPDFLVDARFVVEAKGARHRGPQVLRQLARYAAYPQVEGLILATARAMLMPATIGGKPLLVINLGRAWL